MLASDTESDLDHFGRFKNNPNGFRVLELDTVHNENPVYTHWSLLINDISYESYSFYFALYVQAESYCIDKQYCFIEQNMLYHMIQC